MSVCLLYMRALDQVARCIRFDFMKHEAKIRVKVVNMVLKSVLSQHVH